MSLYIGKKPINSQGKMKGQQATPGVPKADAPLKSASKGDGSPRATKGGDGGAAGGGDNSAGMV